MNPGDDVAYSTGDQVAVTIERVTVRGAGVGSVDGFDVHVHGAAPDDVVRATIQHVSPHRAEGFARLDAIVKPGSGRRDVPCTRSDLSRGDCGGCAWLHLTDRARDTALLDRVDRAFRERALDGARPGRILRAGAATAWRNRSHRIAWTHNGCVVLGARARRGRTMADLSGCLVEQPPLPRVFDRIAALATGLRVPTFDHAGRGLRQVSARTNVSGEVLVELVVTSDEDLSSLVDSVASIASVVGVHVAVVDGPTNSTTGARRIHARGASSIVEDCGPLAIPLGTTSFFQLNTAVAEAMYARAAAWCEGSAHVADLYAGIGGLGLTIAARTGARVDAWEVHAGAIEAGRRLARSMGLRWDGTVADLERIAVDLDPAVDRIVVNPPRRGLSPGVIDTLRQRGNVPVLYMSCSPESFARDVSTLDRPLRRIEAWDMMPGSPHLELLADLGPR